MCVRVRLRVSVRVCVCVCVNSQSDQSARAHLVGEDLNRLLCARGDRRRDRLHDALDVHDALLGQTVCACV